MTLFKFTSIQERFLLEKLFDYDTMKKKNAIPKHIVYYADKHIGIAGILFLSKNTQGIDYQVTNYGMQGGMLTVSKTNEMLAYIETKRNFPMIPTDAYQLLKNLILEQERKR